MKISNFAIPILGLIVSAIPARAGFSFFNNTNASQFNNVNLGMTLSPLETFPLLLSGSPASYTDPNGIQFLGFNIVRNGGSNDVNGTRVALGGAAGTPLIQTVNGGIIQITNFGSNVFAFAVNVGASAFAPLCFEVNHGSFNQSTFCDQTFNVTSSTDVEFFGVASTGPGAVPITSIWIGPQTDPAATTKIRFVSFEFGTESLTPEPESLLLLGAGLALTALFRLRRRASARS